MVDIPAALLNQLRCSQCEGYLSIAPLMVTTAGVQICGKCYKILPADEKRKYVRQVGLEAVAGEMLIFPCRYHQQGCTVQILFNEGEDHERECPHRQILLQDANDCLDVNSTVTVERQTKELHLQSKYSLKRNKNNAVLKYTIDIGASSGYALCLQSEQYLKPVEVKIEGAIALKKNTPESIYCELNASKGASTVMEHVYESINSGPGSVRKCNNCCSTMVNEAWCEYCLLHGNYFCRNNCHSETAAACPQCSSRTSYVHSTPWNTLKKANIHQSLECDFPRFQCPVETHCNWYGILKATKLHVFDKHPDKAVESAEITRSSATSDDVWLMFAHENMFKCKYFYYESFVEVLVIYMGSHDRARHFKYDVAVVFNHKTLRRSAVCIGWNGFSLESGIAIQNAEVLELTRNKQSCKSGFDFTLKISECKESSYL